MIKFFRNIRLRLLTEKNTGKYIKYAVGEIVLVVIGILIALQINNWNTDQQLRSLERKYLTEIKKSLEFDLGDIDFNIDFNENRLNSNKIVLQYVRKEIAYADSLQRHFANLIFTTRTLPNTSAFENLKNKGIEIVSNDSLRQEITKLYSFHYFNTRDFETQDDHHYHYESFIPIVSKVIELTEVWENGQVLDKISIVKDVEFNNALVINIVIREEMLDMYDSLRQKVISCLKHINNELEK